MSEEKRVKSEDVCAVCGKELPTESGRVICKECEVKANDGWQEDCVAQNANGLYADTVG